MHSSKITSQENILLRVMRPTFDQYLSECPFLEYPTYAGLIPMPEAELSQFTPLHNYIFETRPDGSYLRQRLVDKDTDLATFLLSKRKGRKNAARTRQAIFNNRARNAIVCSNDDDDMPGPYNTVCLMER